MSDVKCPICQNNLHKINVVVSTCTNDKCKLWGSSIPNLVLKALAEAKQDLERTRKALGVAWDGLEKIGSGDIIEHSVVGHEDDNKIFIANKTLDESKKALEQK